MSYSKEFWKGQEWMVPVPYEDEGNGWSKIKEFVEGLHKLQTLLYAPQPSEQPALALAESKTFALWRC